MTREEMTFSWRGVSKPFVGELATHLSRPMSTLRMAAIAAVLAACNAGEDPSQIGRKMGEAWAQDHRRMNMGYSSLMHRRNSRSPWR